MKLYFCEYYGVGCSARSFFVAKREGGAIQQFLDLLAEESDWDVSLEDVSVTPINEVDEYDVILQRSEKR